MVVVNVLLFLLLSLMLPNECIKAFCFLTDETLFFFRQIIWVYQIIFGFVDINLIGYEADSASMHPTLWEKKNNNIKIGCPSKDFYYSENLSLAGICYGKMYRFIIIIIMSRCNGIITFSFRVIRKKLFEGIPCAHRKQHSVAISKKLTQLRYGKRCGITINAIEICLSSHFCLRIHYLIFVFFYH